MSHRSNRRRFLQTSAATGIGFWVAGGLRAEEEKEVKSPNERIAIACIGVSGKGASDSKDAGDNADVVAICDVDENTLNGQDSRDQKNSKGEKNKVGALRFPKAKRYTDFRKMLDEMGKSIDAVTISTPDHCHAAAGLMAMRMGKHCFCQKPMTHTIYEARLMAKVAREMKVCTQMGNQGTASDQLRKAAAIIQTGVLGTVKEVHVWTDRPIWAQGGNRPMPGECPGLDWQLWLGPAPERPCCKRGVYHPFAWRGWWDFGTGALGDMACHTVNMPYMALKLFDPISVQATCSGHNKDSYPKWSKIVFDFPANAERGPVKLFWYDGGQLPDDELFKDHKRPKTGALVIGDKDTLLGEGDYADKKPQLLSGEPTPDVTWVHSPGHFKEWILAMQGGKPARSNFADYSGGLTETILLGNLAVWVAASGEGEKVQWDAKNMKATNVAGLEHIIKPTFRPGYTLDV